MARKASELISSGVNLPSSSSSRPRALHPQGSTQCQRVTTLRASRDLAHRIPPAQGWLTVAGKPSETPRNAFNYLGRR